VAGCVQKLPQNGLKQAKIAQNGVKIVKNRPKMASWWFSCSRPRCGRIPKVGACPPRAERIAEASDVREDYSFFNAKGARVARRGKNSRLRGKITQNGPFLTIFGIFSSVLVCFLPILGAFTVLGRKGRKKCALSRFSVAGLAEAGFQRKERIAEASVVREDHSLF
jgi:hypothetical protein